jgi:hypothetical protein
MSRTDGVRLRSCDYSRKHRRKIRALTNNDLRWVSCWIVYYKDELAALLDTIDDTNVSDAELAAVTKLNETIKAAKKECATLMGKRKEADKRARQLRNEASPLVTRLPPPRLVSPPVGEGNDNVQHYVRKILQAAARIGRRREDA